MQANLRPDLRLVIMSATLQGARIERWFDAPRLSSEGRAYPVRITHPPARTDSDALALRRGVEQAIEESTGDVLVFLPGKREIEQARAMLTPALAHKPLSPRERGWGEGPAEVTTSTDSKPSAPRSRSTCRPTCAPTCAS